MLYLATASTEPIREAMTTGHLGLMAQPGNGLGPGVAPGTPWAADNGCFSERWDARRWLAWLDRQADHASTCLFAVVPDVVADAEATLHCFFEWAPEVRRRGFPVGFVAQNGQENLPVPWEEIDVLFTGGTTEWKLGPEATELCAQAQERGKGTHMGRVNSLRRLRLAVQEGYDSVDGTYLTGPDKNLPQLLRFLRLAHQPALWGPGAPSQTMAPPELSL